MTVRLLVAYGIYPANAIVTLDAGTETGLIAANLASATLTGGVVFFAKVISPAPVLALAGGGPVSLKIGEQTVCAMPEGQALTVTGAASTTGTVARLDAAGATVQSWTVGVGTLPAIGPFPGAQQLLITCTAGSIGATLRHAVVGVAATTSIAALVADIRAAYADASARNPFTLGVMAAPPVVTNPASSPLPVAYGYATTPAYFNINGASAAAPQFIDTSLGNYLRMRGARTGVSTYNGGPVWSAPWAAICPSLDISVLASSLPYRLQVDGAWVSATGVTTGANTNINFNFSAVGGSKRRVFVLEMAQDQGFLGIRLGNNDTLFAAASSIPTIVLLGDSYLDGTLSPSGMSGNSVPGAFRAISGCNVISQGLGGTGYVVAGSSLPMTSSIRLDDAAAVNPDLIIVALGTNDFGQAGVAAAVTAVLRGLRARRPTTPIIVFGPWGQALNLSAPVLQTEADIITGFNAASDSLMRFIPMNRASATTTPWTTGTGNTGAVTSSGNSSVMIGPDTVHPSAANGGIYYGQRMALESLPALISMAKSQG